MLNKLAPLFLKVFLLALIILPAGLIFGAEPHFLTLPFADPNVFVGQGWVYDSPGPFPGNCSPYGDRCHKGIDYFLGTRSAGIAFDVLAAAPGKAIASKSESYGYFILIRHPEVDSLGQNYFTIYAHLKQDSWTVSFASKDEVVQNISGGDFSRWKDVFRGEWIATSGDTGAANSIHLHFEVQRGGYALNKTDPYDIYSTNDFYSAPCGSQFLWTQCPPLRPSAQSTVIKFDTFPDGSPVPEGTIITNQYLSLGVIFSAIPNPFSAGVLSIDDASGETDTFIGMSPPNVLVAGGWSPGPGGTLSCQNDLRIDFVNSWVTAFSIRVFALVDVSPATLQLIAKDINGEIVAQDGFLVSSGFASRPAESFTLSVSVGTAKVVSVTIQGGAPGIICTAFDNVTFQ